MAKTNKSDKKTKKKAAEESPKKEEKISQREVLRRFVNKMPVKDLAMNMMTNLITTAYVKMGLPEEQNKQYKDLEQAKQAIDCLDGLLGAADFLSEEEASAFKQTSANLKMAYASAK